MTRLLTLSLSDTRLAMEAAGEQSMMSIIKSCNNGWLTFVVVWGVVNGVVAETRRWCIWYCEVIRFKGHKAEIFNGN